MSSIYPKQTRAIRMKLQTKRAICKLIDEYMYSLGAEIVHEVKLGTEVPGTSRREWSYLTRFGVYMRIAAHGSWIYMSFGYSNDSEVCDAARLRMKEVLGGPNSDGRFNPYSGKYNLIFAQNTKPEDALSLFKGDMSLFIRRKAEDVDESRIELDARYFLDKASKAFGVQSTSLLSANAIRLMIQQRGLDDMSYLEHAEIIKQAIEDTLTATRALAGSKIGQTGGTRR